MLAEQRFYAAVKAVSPALTYWHWYRALDRVRGGRATEDDIKLANNQEINDAYKDCGDAAYAFYKARDGKKGQA